MPDALPDPKLNLFATVATARSRNRKVDEASVRTHISKLVSGKFKIFELFGDKITTTTTTSTLGGV